MKSTQPSETTRRHQHPSTLTRTGCQYLQYCGPDDPDDDESEAVSLELDASRMDHHIKQLQRGKKDKLRRLNALRSATRNLPPETLISIFHHVATPITHSTFLDYSRDPRFPIYMERNIFIIRCASVSSLWRDLILSTPSLWTTSALKIRPNDRQIERELMKLLWERSQELPIAVDLGLEESQGSGGATSESGVKARVKELISLMRGNADRFNMLRLRNPPAPLVRSYTVKSIWPQLKCLSLENIKDKASPASRTITLSHSNLPRLHQLTLRNIWCQIGITKNNISVLDFIETSLVVCIEVFKRCPNVVEVHCRLPKISQDVPDDDSDPTVITFLLLENFTWTLSDNSTNLSFIKRLALPALKVLQLYGDADHIHSIAPQPVIQFFHQLSLSLQELEVVNWGEWTSGGLAQLFNTARHTKKLVLRECFETFNLDMVKLLSLAQTGFANQPEYLPHLKMLSIQSAKTREYLEILPDVMRQRALNCSQAQPFGLEISRPEASTVRLLEAEAAVHDGSIKLKFLEIF
jgi:hypothetical protein